MGILGTLILVTALAGVGGTGLGGLIGAMLQKNSKRIVSLLLSFAGGVMLSVVCFDLVTEAIETETGIWTVVKVYNPTAIPVELSVFHSAKDWRAVKVLPGETADLK